MHAVPERITGSKESSMPQSATLAITLILLSLVCGCSSRPSRPFPLKGDWAVTVQGLDRTTDDKIVTAVEAIAGVESGSVQVSRNEQSVLFRSAGTRDFVEM